MRRVNRQMNIIAAVDANWAIGYKNELLVKIPNDQKWFQKITTGKVVVMGRKTMETFPNGMPLKNRTNIVLTGDRALRVKDAELVYGIEELLEKLKQYNTEDVYVIGGESVYEELLPYCDTAYITKIDYTYQADRYFPNLDNDADWHIESESEEQTYFDLEYYFVKYVRG
jgi:dihydrofolate reductase